MLVYERGSGAYFLTATYRAFLLAMGQSQIPRLLSSLAVLLRKLLKTGQSLTTGRGISAEASQDVVPPAASGLSLK